MADSVEEEIQELSALYWSERDPEGRAFAPLADAYRRQGDHWRALELLREGLGRHAGFTPGLIVSGWVRRDMGEIDAAGEAFGAALALDGENTEALRGLGEIAAERGDPAAATQHYQKLNELEPGDLEIVARLRELERAAPQARVAPVAPTPEQAPEAPEPPSPQAQPWEAGESEEGDSLDTPSFEGLELEEPDAELEPFPDAPAPAAEPMEDGGDGPITRTMADLYAKQGLHDRALRIYRQLLESDPWDDEVKVRVAALEKLVNPPAPKTKRVEADTEALARDWSEGPRETGRIETPFAWTAPVAEVGPEAKPGDEAVPTERPVRDYFRGLLEWEPAPEPVVEPVVEAVVEPVVEAAVEPAFVEPTGPQAKPGETEPTLVEPAFTEPTLAEPTLTELTLAEPAFTEPTVVEQALTEPTLAEPSFTPSVEEPSFEEPVLEPSYEEPAIEEPVAAIEAPSAAVPVETLAPGRVVPIESLAPDHVVPIESLAPVIVDIASLAP